MTIASRSSPVLVFARPEDPFTVGFADYAAERGLSTWQPRRLEDLAWTFHLDRNDRTLEIRDRRGEHCRNINDLAGIWCQSLPPLEALPDLKEAERRYVNAEFSSAGRMLWQEARCPVLGQPPAGCPRGFFDFGLEARVELRRFELPVLTDRAGTLPVLQAALRDVPPSQVRIMRSGGFESCWFSDLLTGNWTNAESAPQPGELMAAAVTDGRSARIVVHVDADILIVDVDDDGTVRLSRENDDWDACEKIGQQVRRLTGARLGVIYLCHQPDGWKIVRLSLQLPYWLADVVGPWMFPKLMRIFSDRPSVRTIAEPRP